MFKRIKSVSGQGGFTVIELVAVLVVLGVIVGFAVARMSDNTERFKEKAMLPLINAFNTHEAGAYANSLLEYDGMSANLAAHSTNTWDLAGLSAHIKGDYSWTAPLDETAAAAGVDVTYQGSVPVTVQRNCLDLAEQCVWVIQ